MSTKSNQNQYSKILLVGLAGTSAVSIQTISLVWTNNVLKKQKKQGLSLFKSALKIYEKGGIKSFFKGCFTPFVYNSFARFGDTTSNFIVLNFFKNNQILQQTPLFLQTLCSWGMASLWRVVITPLTMISQFPSSSNSARSNSLRPKYNLVRTYFKLVKPEIMSLYSWLLVQNYLIEYTNQIKYEENSLMAFLRFGSFGFLSMISYDCYLKVKSNLIKSKNHSGFSKYWLNKVFVKGLYGVIFCASSQYLKESFDKSLEEEQSND